MRPQLSTYLIDYREFFREGDSIKTGGGTDQSNLFALDRHIPLSQNIRLFMAYSIELYARGYQIT